MKDTSRDVRLFKMLNGDEIVTYVSVETQDTLEFTKGRAIVPQRLKDGSVTLILIPWIHSAGDDDHNIVTVQRATICGEVKRVPPDLEAAFIQQTSPIQQVTGNEASKILLGGR
jgi:hypothetical protein